MTEILPVNPNYRLHPPASPPPTRVACTNHRSTTNEPNIGRNATASEKTMSLHHNGTNTTKPLQGLIHLASLTNQELFTAVVAVIKRSFNKQKKKNNQNNQNKDWQNVAVRVATSAAKGEDGYYCGDDWVRKFNELSTSEGAFGVGSSNNFREALKSLPVQECYRKRLGNALSALSSSTALDFEDISIQQVAGLLRGSTFLSTDGNDDVNTVELQARTLSYLVRVMPRLASNPRDIFLAVQLPILQKLKLGAFNNCGLAVRSSADVETEFRSLLSLDFGEQCKSSMHSGEKRKCAFISNDNDTAAANNESNSNTIHLLEAAHLARNGAVRAQHGAVIYIPTEKNNNNGESTEAQVIGRGWNHDFILDRSKTNKNKIVLHSEAHAVADAIRHHGEDKCFDELFPRATIMIVELESDYGYDTCHPCPKCDPLLRAVGITNVLHTTPRGTIEELDLSPANANMLCNIFVSMPLSAACQEQKIRCKRLERAEGFPNVPSPR